MYSISRNSYNAKMRHRLQENLAMRASFVSNHGVGDVLEKLHKVHIWIFDLVPLFVHHGEERLGSASRLDDGVPNEHFCSSHHLC